MFDGVLAGSYIARMERLGQPVRSVEKRYRLIDLYARAKANGHAVSPSPQSDYELKLLASGVDGLRAEIAQLETKKAILAAQVEKDERAMALCGYAKALTGSTLLTESEIVSNCSRFAECCGVYFLIKAGRVVYVGQSVNVYGRIYQHLVGKDFDSFAYVPCETESLDILESLYIHVLRPPLNGEQCGAPVAPIRLNKLIKMATRK
jgi:hypothetical protein